MNVLQLPISLISSTLGVVCHVARGGAWDGRVIVHSGGDDAVTRLYELNELNGDGMRGITRWQYYVKTTDHVAMSCILISINHTRYQINT